MVPQGLDRHTRCCKLCIALHAGCCRLGLRFSVSRCAQAPRYGGYARPPPMMRPFPGATYANLAALQALPTGCDSRPLSAGMADTQQLQAPPVLMPLPPPQFRPQLMGRMPVRTQHALLERLPAAAWVLQQACAGCAWAGRGIPAATGPGWPQLRANAARPGADAGLCWPVPARRRGGWLRAAAAAGRARARAAAVPARAATVHGAAGRAVHVILCGPARGLTAASAERRRRAVRGSGKAVCRAGGQPGSAAFGSGRHVRRGDEEGCAGGPGRHEGARASPVV